MNFSQIKEADILTALPIKVKTTEDVIGVVLVPSGVGMTKVPVTPAKIPMGTIVTLSVNPSDKTQIVTDYQINGKPVYTSPLQVVGRAESVTNEEGSGSKIEAKTTDSQLKDEPKGIKKFLTPKNILIGAGVVVAGVLAWKFLIKKKA